MNLLYLWVKQYKNLKNVGIPFTGEYLFNAIYGNDQELERIEITRNEDYVPDFFRVKNLTSVTAIVGQNGVGKTNLIELLRKLMPEGDRILYQEIVVVLEVETNRRKTIECWMADTLRAKIQLDGKQIVPKPQKMNESPSLSPRVEHPASATVLHYSNTLSFVSPTEYAGVIDITTSGLLQTDQDQFTEKNKSLRNQVEAHISAELDRNIAFLFGTRNQAWRETLGFDLPRRLSITPAVTNQKILMPALEDVKGGNLLRELYWTDVDSQGDKRENFLKGVLFSMIYSWILHKVPIRWAEFAEILSRGFREHVEYGPKWFSNAVRIATEDVRVRGHKSIAKSTTFLFRAFEEGLKTETIMLLGEPLMAVVAMEKPGARQVMQRINGFHADASFLGPFLDFKWANEVQGETLSRRLSAGEQARLSFFSRLYSATHGRLRLKDDPDRSAILLIDEGDTYYHPEWQRRFLSDLLKAVQWFFRNRQVQVVIASNAPFILSDLPHWAVVYIKRKDGTDEVAVEVPLGPEASTFAQNIHTLLASSFFMKSTIGLIADNTIQHFLDQLISGKQGSPRMLKIIRMIGEPIIRQRLLELWLTSNSASEQIRFHKEEIERLEKDSK